MSVRLFRFVPAVAGLLMASCGDDSAPAEPEEVTPSTVKLVSVGPPSGSFEPPTVPCDGRLLVRVEPDATWTLRAPGGCGARERCGHLFVRAFGSEVETSTRTINRSALLELSPPEVWATSITFEVSLALDSGEPFLDADGATVSDSLTLELGAPEQCSTPGEDGAGGSGSE
ncbi:MAG TPA: hypothetical protein VIM73_05530 [Polyangiaceae bacterium]